MTRIQRPTIDVIANLAIRTDRLENRLQFRPDEPISNLRNAAVDDRVPLRVGSQLSSQFLGR
ncbi:MAG: hypothetical protein ACK559_33995, partial [bacterium]